MLYKRNKRHGHYTKNLDSLLEEVEGYDEMEDDKQVEVDEAIKVGQKGPKFKAGVSGSRARVRDSMGTDAEVSTSGTGTTTAVAQGQDEAEKVSNSRAASNFNKSRRERLKKYAAEEDMDEGEYRSGEEGNNRGQFAIGMDELLAALDELEGQGELTPRQVEEIAASVKAKAEVESGERDDLPGVAVAEEDDDFQEEDDCDEKAKSSSEDDED
jgi:hypothetical protein